MFLVEDNDAVRRATETFVNVEGFQTSSASNISDAERLLRSVGPGDVVIADYRLDSQHTGLDLLNMVLQRMRYDIPGIILSGDLATVVRTVGKPPVHCVFLSKPVDVDALVQAINTLTASTWTFTG
jgi:DNA-binding NtrC family response regulator